MLFRIRLRLSMKVLMCLILGLALWLGSLTNKAHRQREAVAAIRALGGEVVHDDELVNGRVTLAGQPGAPRWLRQALGDEYFHDVVAVIFFRDGDPKRAPNATTKGLWLKCRQLQKMEVLTVMAEPDLLTDEALEQIAGFPHLKELHLSNATQVTDAGLAHLAKLKKLRILSITGTRMSDTGLLALIHLPELSQLGIGRTLLTDRGLARLKNLKALEALSFDECRATDDGLMSLRALSRLKKLKIGGVRKRPSQGFISIEAIKKLEAAMPGLNVEYYVPGSGWDYFPRAAPDPPRAPGP